MNAIKLLGSLMGNNATGGGLLGSLMGGGGSGGGGLGALTSMLGGGGGGGGGLGALAGMLGGGGSGGGGGGGGLGALLGGLGGGAAAQAVPEKEENDAVLLIKAMCNAAKADGQIDQDEIKNIVGRLGEVDEAEAQFLKQELEAPVDLEGFLQSVPQDMTQQVYAFSLMGMKLDSKQEAQYLAAVAQGLRLDSQVANSIHEQLGAPKIFG